MSGTCSTSNRSPTSANARRLTSTWPSPAASHRHAPPVALQQPVVVRRDDDLGDLRREEAAQPSQLLELRDLLPDALFEPLVQLAEIGRLPLDRVVVLLDPQERADARQELRLFDRLADEIVGARVQRRRLLPRIL